MQNYNEYNGMSGNYLLVNHFVKSIQIRSFLWSEYRKIRARKIFGFGHFSRSVILMGETFLNYQTKHFTDMKMF